MDDGPFIDGLPIEHGDFQVRKLLVDQRFYLQTLGICQLFIEDLPSKSDKILWNVGLRQEERDVKPANSPRQPLQGSPSWVPAGDISEM